MRIDSFETSREETHQSLKRVEEQCQGFTQPPSDNNQNGDDEQCDLDTRSDGNAHRQIEFSFTGDNDCGGMFCSVGDDGNDDEGDPFLVDRRMLYETINTLNETLGSKVGDDRDGDQKEQGGMSVHAGILDVVRGSSTCVGLDGQGTLDILHTHGQDTGGGQMGLSWFMNDLEIGSRTRPGSGGPRGRGGRRILDVDEEMVVGVELEEEVCEVNENEDNRGTTTELEEIRGFKAAIDSAFQPFMLGERSGIWMEREMSRGSLRMQRG